MTAVLVEDVSRTFGEVIAVNRVNLKVERGEFVTLLGPSGCGKTTTLRMVAGLEQNTSGRISIGERVVSDADAGFFVPPDHRQLGMVFQSYAIWPHMTVFDNVAYPLRIRRKSKAEIKRTRRRRCCASSRWRNIADRPAPALSGGQQQRVAIARALVFEPEVLLLDEPLSNLDARLRTQMGDEFRALQKRLGITSLYVTHDQEEAMALSDRVVVMQAGRILQIGTPEEIYQRPTTARSRRSSARPTCSTPRSPAASREPTENSSSRSPATIGLAIVLPANRSRPVSRFWCWCGPKTCGSVATPATVHQWLGPVALRIDLSRAPRSWWSKPEGYASMSRLRLCSARAWATRFTSKCRLREPGRSVSIR